MKRALVIVIVFILTIGLCACAPSDHEAATLSTTETTNDSSSVTPVVTDSVNTIPETTNPQESTSPSENSILPTNTHTHNWTKATCTIPKTCSGCGMTKGIANGHNWKEATCTAPRTCSRCKTTEGVMISHRWTKATCTNPKTCQFCGKTDGTPSNHKWDQDGTCQICNTEHSAYTDEYTSITKQYNKQIIDIEAQILDLYEEVSKSNEIISEAETDKIALLKTKNSFIEKKAQEHFNNSGGSSSFCYRLAQEEWERHYEIMSNHYEDIITEERMNIITYNGEITILQARKRAVEMQYKNDVIALRDKYL